MIIVCPECSTKFDIDSDRIPDGGAKVRCARCKHVFRAEKPLDLESKHPEEIDFSAEEPVTNSTIEETSSRENLNEPIADDSNFSYDKFQELDSEATNEETFTFGAETETKNEDITLTESPEELDTIEKIFMAKNDNPVPPETVAEEDVVNKTTTNMEPLAEARVASQPVEKKKGGPISSIIRILLLLILVILIIGGVFVYINGPDQLNQTIQQIFGQQTNRSVQTGQITLSELEGKFIKNEHDGDLFLIHGEAINNFSQPRAAIQVKGVIFDQNGKPLLQKTVFCGNPISLQEIQTLSFIELEKIMGNQFGKDLSNMKIDSKKAIPFDIVFKDLPQNLSEFSVKVTSSEAVTK
ncbi:MAG: zinc-ribbon domain-containing protein [Desulfuromusa sp.]|nr:zinc-ribbon domain-containing protein [Desulfuromusa sp.]